MHPITSLDMNQARARGCTITRHRKQALTTEPNLGGSTYIQVLYRIFSLLDISRYKLTDITLPCMFTH